MEKRVFSGIQPTGDLHIGNYLGAIRNWVRLLDEYDCIFCVVDYHAITIEYEPSEMQRKILNAAATNMACGLDPERCILFVQSHVPEHTELAWIFNTITPVGELDRMTQFKEKSRQHRANVNMGLYDYPVLQTADILLYKGEYVPVGEDQVQHIELSREIARKFNTRFGEVFPEPRALLAEVPKILGLDGKTKMSKSLNNYISLVEEPQIIWQKLSTAVTDENRKRRTDPGNPDVCNIFTLHKSFSHQDEIEMVNRECRTAGIGCLDCKKILSDNMVEALTPIRAKTGELLNSPSYVQDVLAEGAKRCKTMAEETMDEVRTIIGLR